MRYLLLTLTMLLTVGLFAQRGGERGKREEKIQQQRVAYISTELDLNAEEAQAFWPLFNEYQTAKKEIGLGLKESKKIDDITEEEANELLSSSMEAKRKHVDLEHQFMNNLAQVLPAKKRLKFVRVEREFKKNVLKRYKKRMKGGEKMDGKKEKRRKEQKEE